MGSQSTIEPSAQELQQELKNFEDYSKVNYPLVRNDTNASSMADLNERVSGYPNPVKYD